MPSHDDIGWAGDAQKPLVSSVLAFRFSTHGDFDNAMAHVQDAYPDVTREEVAQEILQVTAWTPERRQAERETIGKRFMQYAWSGNKDAFSRTDAVTFAALCAFE